MSSLKVFKIKTKSDLDKAFSIREEVFVIEQEVDKKLEYDEYEDSSTHFLCELNNIAIGTARWRFTQNGIKLERFAVVKNSRNTGAGKALLDAVLLDLPYTKGIVYLHAQISALPFYEKAGFIADDIIFEEAGILHKKMKLGK